MRQDELDKIIEIVGFHTDKEEHGYCDTGSDMDFYCRSECINMAIIRLTAASRNGEI